MPQGLLDRLALDPQRVADVAQALRDVAALPDPVGEVVRGSTLANGLQIRQVGCRWAWWAWSTRPARTSPSTRPASA